MDCWPPETQPPSVPEVPVTEEPGDIPEEPLAAEVEEPADLVAVEHELLSVIEPGIGKSEAVGAPLRQRVGLEHHRYRKNDVVDVGVCDFFRMKDFVDAFVN